ncbi:hypothetical protein [Calothrix sp. UHCC 0171]|uniref:hypothetical protein n=1 Tax=Calothrix sp. UHCC 0171 TaxID=3110245 RepID=UPI002B1EF944|nr:hypothetical protein [Calothrix sp. UHCC 0171]MEA5573174.1 hypothetical protein [Calothrix sp. UHCC 0171]
MLFTITLIGIIGYTYLSKRSPIFSCYEWGFSSNATKYYTHPEKIVVKPWRGQHHVFGIFMIPGGYLNDNLFKLEIPGEQTYCGVLAYEGTVEAEGVRAKPGAYLMKGLLNTRTALWLISQGKVDELKKIENWKVGYSKSK